MPTLPTRISAKIPANAGIGLRFCHHKELTTTLPKTGWLEVHSENYFCDGGPATRLSRKSPRSLSTKPSRRRTLPRLYRTTAHRSPPKTQTLTDRFEPGLVSEHVSWTGLDGTFSADLLPLPYTEEALTTLCDNIARTQDALGRQILVENPSSYLTYTDSPMTEWDFMTEVAKRSGCGILFDVNNVYVSAMNHGYDPMTYIDAIPTEHVQEIHLAGHTINTVEGHNIRIDHHGDHVCDEVWQLYRATIHRTGRVPTLIEWDTDIPALSVLLDETAKADAILNEETSHAHAA